MKTYAHFTTNGKENLGSDAWFRLDGRNTLRTQIIDSGKRMKLLSNIHPNYNGFQIRVGEKPSTSKIIYTTSR